MSKRGGVSRKVGVVVELAELVESFVAPCDRSKWL